MLRPDHDHDPPVGIVGAGLAGLACAERLHEWGMPFVVFEASDGVGGRARSDDFQGFILDRGFQIFLTSYEQAAEALDLQALGLRPFYPGALTRVRGRFKRIADPCRRPVDFARTLLSPPVGPADALRSLRLAKHARQHLENIRRGEHTPPTREYLERAHLSKPAMQRFYRPFLGGVFLDARLDTPRAFCDFVLDRFRAGDATLPARGMRALAEQLAAGLPAGSLRLRTPVAEIGPDFVRTAAGERLVCSAVVLATDAATAAAMRPEIESLEKITWNQTETVYYAAEQPPVREPILVLRGDDPGGPVNHMCVPSLVQPPYAPPGAHLISCTVVGMPPYEDDAALDKAVREQMTRWFGGQVRAWKLLRVYRIPRALPRQFSLGGGLAVPRRTADGVWLAGDYLENPSIEGAIASGRRKADAVLKELGHKPSNEPRLPQR